MMHVMYNGTLKAEIGTCPSGDPVSHAFTIVDDVGRRMMPGQYFILLVLTSHCHKISCGYLPDAVVKHH